MSATMNEMRVFVDVSIPLLVGEVLDIDTEDVYDDEISEETLQGVVSAFLGLNDGARVSLCYHLFAYYRDIVAEVGSEALELTQPINCQEDVWSQIRVDTVSLMQGDVDNTLFIVLRGECTWEPEHGVLIAYRGGKELTFVGGDEGHISHEDDVEMSQGSALIYDGHLIKTHAGES